MIMIMVIMVMEMFCLRRSRRAGHESRLVKDEMRGPRMPSSVIALSLVRTRQS